MKILLIKNGVMQSYVLPSTIYGSFWIIDKDSNNNKRYLINVVEYEGKWRLNSNYETKIVVNNMIQQSILLSEYTYCFLDVQNEKTSFILYFMPTIDNNIQKLDITNYGEITIGSAENNAIVYRNSCLSANHAKLTYNNGKWTIQNLDTRYGTYVNNRAVNNVSLFPGDIVFIMGLRIIAINNFILINNPNNAVTYNKGYLNLPPPVALKTLEELEQDSDEIIKFYDKNEYFFRAPRFKNAIIPITIKLDAPPAKEKQDEMPDGRKGANQGIVKALMENNIADRIEAMSDIIQKRYNNMSEVEITKYLNSLDTKEGICSYANAANVIYNTFKNKPNAFEEYFGYPMYRTLKNGSRVFNDELLLVDLHSFANMDTVIKNIDGEYKYVEAHDYKFVPFERKTDEVLENFF